jgi:5-(carboxyamino)imidazole ribonucleotide synthase
VAGPVVGIIGGGQLARMLAEAATPLGVHVRVLVADGEEGAAEVAPDVLAGSATDPAALRELASGVDVVTIDHENVDVGTLAELEAEGVAVRPGTSTLAFADKAHQRRAFAVAGLPVPDFVVVDPVGGPGGVAAAVDEADAFAGRHGARVVAKASRGGYDGRGVWMPDADGLPAFLSSYLGAPLVLEPRLDLEIELAVLVARRPSGEVATWPVVETVQVDGMCDEVILPAPVDPALAQRAREVAARVAEVTGAVGVLAVELFVTGGEVLVNEIAPRVHNSGHLTIEGCATSQFEQHLRAVLDWPLGPTDPVAPVAVMANVVGGSTAEPRDRQSDALAAVPGAHIHLYGKTARPKRKVGHVTVLGGEREATRAAAARAAAVLAGD